MTNKETAEPLKKGDWVCVRVGLTRYEGAIGQVTVVTDRWISVMFSDFREQGYEPWELELIDAA